MSANDYYERNCDALLLKYGKFTMEANRLCTLPIEIFKTLNNENPTFMRQIFFDLHM